MSAAASVFSKKLKVKLSTSTVQSIKKAYLSCAKERRKADDSEDISSLPHKKRGRPLLLGTNLDTKYLLKVREGGGVVTARVAIDLSMEYPV